ncbi:MAG: hypothetical protein RL442_2516, partial [Pseudomonadota bacterium]
SLTLTSYAFSVSAGWVRAMPSSMSQVAELIQFLLFTASVAGLFHYVPNTQVRWTHAWAGALFVSIAFELAKKGLAWYVSAVPAYATIYGAFAAVPILLLWIYLVWLIVLWGAVIAAYAPSLTMGVTDGKDLVGQDFSLGVSLLSCLDAARHQPDFGSTCLELARQTILIRELFADFQKSNPVTDADIKAEYDKFVAANGGKEYRARHILVEKEEQAKAILASLKKGGKFEDIAKKQSKDPGSGANGGDLDWASAGNFVKEFSDAMVALKKGQVTDAPVKSQFGFHIIRLDDVREAQLPKLDDVKAQISQQLQQAKMGTFQQELRAKARIE